jgi:acyl transferase domain-containing protein/acyl carrier protein
MDKYEAIAVIGMAGRFPAAVTVDELWNLLRRGDSGVWTPSDDELRTLGVSEESLSDPNYVRARMRFEGTDFFDAGFFGYSARHAQMLDPQQRLFLECAWEALETAGYDPATCDGSIGVFASCGTNVYLLDRALLAYRDAGSWRKSDWLDMLVDADKDHIATRVSYKLGLTGPSIGVQTTCSSSLVAVHLACESLRRGECDLALAGGVSLMAAQHLRGYVYVKDGMNSPDGYCRAFDANAAGTAWGSGLGMVALKRHEDAVRDGDHICALIEGSAINNDGAAKMGYNAPSVRGQQEVIALAQSLADVSPDDIDLIEAHGTGTSLGDSIELAALIELFGASAAGRDEPCALGSIKTNIGHLDVASGVTGLIKAVLCLEHRAFVPSLNFSIPNPALCEPNCPLSVNTEYRPWASRPERPRRACVSSLGFGGTNAHAVLREATVVPRLARASNAIQLFPLSARGPAALVQMRNQLAAHMYAHPELDLGDVAFTLQAGRRRFRHRQVIVADSHDHLIASLKNPTPDSFFETVSDRTDCTVVFAFGEGSAATGGAIESLYQSDSAFRADLDACERACPVHADVDLTALALGCPDPPGTATTDSFVARALRFALEYATARLWLRWGVAPAFVIGCGRGRLTAQCVAGTLTVDDALRSLQDQPENGQPANDRPALTPADAVSIYRMDSSKLSESPASAWQDVMRDIDCVFLQLGPGTMWADLLTRKYAREHCPALLTAFIEGESDVRQQVSRVLAKLWLHGIRIDWQRLHQDERRMRVPLPTYPFERARYWLPIPESPPEVLSQAAESSVQPGNQRFFVPSWRVAPTSELASSALPEPGESWLILAENAFGEQLARRLESQGAVPIVVIPAAEFCKIGERKFAIVPDSTTDHARLFRELQARNLRPTRFVHCWTLMNTGASPTSAETFWQQQTLVYFSLLALAKALAAQTQAGERSLVVVTRRTYALGENDCGCNLANATIPGLCKIMSQELSDLRSKLLDLSGADDLSESAGDEIDFARILAEATRNSSEHAVAYRGGLRLVQTLHEQDLPADLPVIRDLRERGVYVITGGLGKIGLALAKRLAQTCKARLVLVTRNPFPEREVWPSVRNQPGAQTVAAKIRALADIEAIGSEVAVCCADVRNEEQLERAFAYAESRFGPIAGVFHLAADMTHPSVHCPLNELTRPDVEAQMGPKIGGFYALSRVLETRQPDFGVLFSSNSSILGGFGFGAYAAANSFLDQCVSAPLTDQFQWLCINWDRWSDHTPVAAESDAERYTITTKAGLDALWAIMTRSTAPQVIVATAALRERYLRWVGRYRKPATTPRRVRGPAHSGVAPRTELERTIATIWQEVLGCEEIGVEDGFLDLGGDSLIALRILARLREYFQVEIPLKAMLGQRSTVASLVLQLVTELQQEQPVLATSAPNLPK